jgi:hypothetical protein
MNAQSFQEYLDAFHSRTIDKWLSFYDPDIEFNLSSAGIIRGPQNIAKFYAQFDGVLNEHVGIDDLFFDSAGTRICVESTTVFGFLKDVPDFLGRGPMKKGDKMIGKTIIKV